MTDTIDKLTQLNGIKESLSTTRYELKQLEGLEDFVDITLTAKTPRVDRPGLYPQDIVTINLGGENRDRIVKWLIETRNNKIEALENECNKIAMELANI